MKILVTGSAGHLGEALVRTLSGLGHEAVGVDIRKSNFTHRVGSIADNAFVNSCMKGVDAVLHAATLHKPHVATHSKQAFVDTNITGTLNLLEAAVGEGVRAFVYTSTTSAFGFAMRSAAGEPAVWVTERLQPIHKNIYGASKVAAEGLCELFSRDPGLPCVVLRTSRFFPEQDDDRNRRGEFGADNLKVNELLFRRVDIKDVVSAHLAAIERAAEIRFDRFIISATSPFQRSDTVALGTDAPTVVRQYAPEYVEEYQRRGWRMFSKIGRVYDNAHAREVLGWDPKFTFAEAVRRLREGGDYRSELAQTIGAKGYHEKVFDDGPYPVQEGRQAPKGVG